MASRRSRNAVVALKLRRGADHRTGRERSRNAVVALKHLTPLGGCTILAPEAGTPWWH